MSDLNRPYFCLEGRCHNPSRRMVHGYLKDYIDIYFLFDITYFLLMKSKDIKRKK